MEEAEKETTTASKMVQQVEKLSEKLAEEVTAEKPIEVYIFFISHHIFELLSKFPK